VGGEHTREHEGGVEVIDASTKHWIDHASYEELLERWRNAPVGSPWFRGEVGQYYKEVMGKRREEVGNAEQVRASKSIGWGGDS
jgi:hypothetical protein